MTPTAVHRDVSAADRLAWRMLAACRGLDPEIFFPLRPTSGVPSRHELAAKRVCGGCPVAAQCLTWAMQHGEDWGIWGGLSERERRGLRMSWLSNGSRNGSAPIRAI